MGSDRAPLESKAGVRVALAQFRPVVGDLAANAARVLGYARAAQREGGQLLICPELALLGYPPDDLLQRPGLPTALEATLNTLAADLPPGVAVLCGAPEFVEQGVHNAAWLLAEGSVQVVARKRALPNFGVFDERRHFSPGEDAGGFSWRGQYFSVLICEDVWDERICGGNDGSPKPVANIVINASPFDRHKRSQRHALLERRSAGSEAPWVYVNAIGGQDELIFDGDTQVWQAGKRINHAAALREGLLFQDLEPVDKQWVARPAFWGADPYTSEDALLYRALTVGIRDYFRRNGFQRIFVGLSGGIDSALVLALAADAVGGARVTAVAMPSPYTAQMSLDDAEAEARALGVEYRVTPIAPLMAAYEQALSPWHEGLAADSTEENVQARARGTLLMAMANKAGGLVLATGNKSEMAVGYCTLYGDMCGGYAPIKDVYKTSVYALSRWRNRRGEVIPERVITRPPSAELRPDQKDEDSLPPYEVLDSMLESLVEDELSADETIAQGFAAADVARVQQLLRFAEFKRRQAAPGPKVTRRAFGRERRYPITGKYPLI